MKKNIKLICAICFVFALTLVACKENEGKANNGDGNTDPVTLEAPVETGQPLPTEHLLPSTDETPQPPEDLGIPDEENVSLPDPG